MSEKLLTFEFDQEGEQVYVHANRAGLDYLIDQLCELRDAASNDHIHLMTPAWGGNELSGEAQSPQFSLIHHVKIYKWVEAS